MLSLLADGELHSEEVLARGLEIDRAAVRDQVAKLSRWGLDVESGQGEGYRLSRPLDLLSLPQLRAELRPGVLRRVSRMEVFLELDSTNAHLLEVSAPAPGRLSVALAEFQRAGRGRQGRPWNTPLGGGICLSAGWTFRQTPRGLSALSLAAGVVTRRVIASMTGCAPALKWPNDLVWRDRKLGGILVEMAARRQGTCHVVIGVGLNVSMDADRLLSVSDWRRGAIDLQRMTAGRAPPRNALAARLIEGLYELSRKFSVRGFSEYRASFLEADYLRRRRVVVGDGPNPVFGRAVGVDADGALVLETETGTRRILSGDVSVRPVR